MKKTNKCMSGWQQSEFPFLTPEISLPLTHEPASVINDFDKLKTPEYWETFGIDYAFGHYGLFTTEWIRTGGKHTIYFKDGHWEIYAPEFPNFHDFGKFLAIMKILEDFNGNVYIAGKRMIGFSNEQKEVSVSGIKISQRKLCEYCGLTPGKKNSLEIKNALIRLRNTTIYEYRRVKIANQGNEAESNDIAINSEPTNSNNSKSPLTLIRTFNLLSDLAWTNPAINSYSSKKIELVMDSALLASFRTRNHKIRWRKIQQLKGQVEKALLLYCDCNNFSEEAYYSESRLVKFLFRLQKPIYARLNYDQFENDSFQQPSKNIKKYVDKKNAERKIRYIKELAEYKKKCIEFRSKIKDAFKILVANGLILEFSSPLKSDEKRLWRVVKVNHFGKKAKIRAFRQAQLKNQECDDGLPF